MAEQTEPTRQPDEPEKTPGSGFLRLFLDDDPARADAFLDRFPDAHWVQNVTDCIAALAEKTWDEIHLDHDLEGEWFVDPERQDCGMEVVRWLTAETRTHLLAAKFIVHTHNHNAAMVMVTQLGLAGYYVIEQPFGSADSAAGRLEISDGGAPGLFQASNPSRNAEPLKDEPVPKSSLIKRILRWFVPPPNVDKPWNPLPTRAKNAAPSEFHDDTDTAGWGRGAESAQAYDPDADDMDDEPGPYVFPVREDDPESFRTRPRGDGPRRIRPEEPT